MKDLLKNKNLYFIVGGVVLLFAIIILLYNYMHLTKLEKELLIEQSNKVMKYYDVYVNSDSESIDKYMLYALTYSDNENDKSSLNNKEIKEILASVFNKEFNEEEINNVGITPLFMDYSVMQNYETSSYYIDKNVINQTKIATIKFNIYYLKSIKKRGNNYTLEYENYLIDNPYEILNYYNDKEGVDTSKINEYLRAKGKIKDIKEATGKDFLESKAKKLDNIEVTYILKGSKFLIK